MTPGDYVRALFLGVLLGASLVLGVATCTGVFQ
jgi:hypothetical protein